MLATRWLALLALTLFLQLAQADIYRYQDEQGGWHFTDDPPPGADLVPGYAQADERPPTGDLISQLERDFDAVTPVARATLSVVTIKTDSGEGSGFFCSREGHILTSQHVIRPFESGQFQAREESLDGKEQELTDLESDLKEGRRELGLMEKDLEGYERVMERAGDTTAREWATNSHSRLSERYRTQKASLQAAERKLETVKRDLRKRRRDLHFERDSEAVTSVFDLVLKDGTELTVSLVDDSAEDDLALLKLEGFRTPYLRLDPSVSLSQGKRVFAVGNPLGMQNSVTSGVITRVTPEYVHTDVQMLPGNSGGPLITEDGEVIGINVAKDVSSGGSVYSPGFGKAIPIERALDAFPQISEYLGKRK